MKNRFPSASVRPRRRQPRARLFMLGATVATCAFVVRPAVAGQQPGRDSRRAPEEVPVPFAIAPGPLEVVLVECERAT